MNIINKRTKELIRMALEEDHIENDITTNSLFPEYRKAEAIVMAKSDGILCGLDIFKEVFLTIGKDIKFKTKFKDGDEFKKGDTIIEIEGDVRIILKGERTALDFLGHLSGIATKTNSLVKKTEGRIKVLDTRKTTPGFRHLEKYAVKTGGGHNHRMNLEEMAMLKENHLIFFNSIKEAVDRIRKRSKDIKIEVEVKNLKEFKEVLNLKVDRIMLDNFSLEDIREAVKINGGRRELEISGGVNESNIEEYSLTGADYVSSGALTHSFKNSDFSLLIKK